MRHTFASLLAVAALALLPEPTYAHSGGLDANGGHAGSRPYHCHREPCFSRQRARAATRQPTKDDKGEVDMPESCYELGIRFGWPPE